MSENEFAGNDVPLGANHNENAAKKVVLVSCVKTKRNTPSAAKDLYASALFAGMRQFAERADMWFVLSAKYGMVRPEEIILPYERTLNKMLKAERSAWARMVEKQLLSCLPPRASIVVLAGARYREEVVPFLRGHGFTVEVPMQGLTFGHQRRWLKGKNV